MCYFPHLICKFAHLQLDENQLHSSFQNESDTTLLRSLSNLRFAFLDNPIPARKLKNICTKRSML